MKNDASPTDLAAFDQRIAEALGNAESLVVRGRVIEVLGNLIKAAGVRAAIGEVCELRLPARGAIGFAEVVGFSGSATFLSALGQSVALSADVQVHPLGNSHTISVGDGLLGRVLNGFGTPMDKLGAVPRQASIPVDQTPPGPLDRRAVSDMFETGFRVVDTLLACGVGQRIGIFAPAGVGKSTFISELARRGKSDVNVVALVGERGREVGDFIRQNLDAETRARTVIVAATSDRSAMERVRAAQVATAIAEYFRDQDKQVLLLVDSLTRLARAQREIGLAMGEPPTRRGFPPSVFTLLPRLLERSGVGSRGAITAFYTVLTEGDEQDDPIAEEVRAILDGHFILSRDRAASEVFPALDVLASNSRLTTTLLNAAQKALVADCRRLLARYEEVRLLVQMGEYKRGTDALTDRAIAFHDGFEAFCRQPHGEPAVSAQQAFEQLRTLLKAAE